MASMFPSLVSGFDDSGNAILDIGNSAESAKEKVTELLAEEKNLSAYQVYKESKDVRKGLVAEND